MFNNLSKKDRKKLLLNVFVYYPLAFVIGISIAIAILKYIGVMNDVPPGYIIILAIIGIIIGVRHISQIYKSLLNKNDRKKDVLGIH